MSRAKDLYHDEICANSSDDSFFGPSDPYTLDPNDFYDDRPAVKPVSIERVANRLFTNWATEFKSGNGLMEWYRDGLNLMHELEVSDEPINAKAA